MASRPELPTAIVRYPSSPGHPITVGFEGVEVEGVIASRETLSTFEGLEAFDVPGVYVLLGAAEAPFTRSARPGESASTTLATRLRFHLAIKSDDTKMGGKTLLGWDTAALFRRVSGEFNLHETGILEARLHSAVERATNISRVGNASRYNPERDPQDVGTRVLMAVLVGLRLAGLDLRTDEDMKAIKQTAPRHRPASDSV